VEDAVLQNAFFHLDLSVFKIHTSSVNSILMQLYG
jgi:hypothetical protein